MFFKRCFFTVGLTLLFCVFCAGCLAERIRLPRGVQPQEMEFEVTGYCNCRKCCSWERSWLGFGPPVVSKGPDKGRRKQVGVTASGSRAKHGTVAADISVLPYGTVLEVPGYGYARVEDRGGAINGKRLDLWFSSHDEAIRWGRKRIKVKVWRVSNGRRD